MSIAQYIGIASRAIAGTSGMLLLAAAFGCSDSTEPDSSPTESSESETEPEIEPNPSEPSRSVPLEVVSYADGAGEFLRVQISVNGSAPFGVLLDTGSDGLRVFANALGDTAISVSEESMVAQFGFGNRMVGHQAEATIAFGELATDEPIAIHLVESFECAPDAPNCDFADGAPAFLVDSGIQGILGVSSRRGYPANVYSPFAQLAPELREAFIINTGGFDQANGTLVFAPTAAERAAFALIPLKSQGAQPNGLPAWADDQVEACFTIGGVPVEPACTEVVFDSGASVDIVYAPNLDPALVQQGVVAPGVSFQAAAKDALDLSFTVGDFPTPGVDLVFIDDTIPFGILGIGTFFRNRVLYDQRNGVLGFSAFK